MFNSTRRNMCHIASQSHIEWSGKGSRHCNSFFRHAALAVTGHVVVAMLLVLKQLLVQRDALSLTCSACWASNEHAAATAPNAPYLLCSLLYSGSPCHAAPAHFLPSWLLQLACQCKCSASVQGTALQQPATL
jgi:hypothetical protein